MDPESLAASNTETHGPLREHRAHRIAGVPGPVGSHGMVEIRRGRWESEASARSVVQKWTAAARRHWIPDGSSVPSFWEAIGIEEGLDPAWMFAVTWLNAAAPTNA